MQATITYLLTEQAQRAQMAATGQPVARRQSMTIEVTPDDLPLCEVANDGSISVSVVPNKPALFCAGWHNANPIEAVSYAPDVLADIRRGQAILDAAYTGACRIASQYVRDSDLSCDRPENSYYVYVPYTVLPKSPFLHAHPRVDASKYDRYGIYSTDLDADAIDLLRTRSAAQARQYDQDVSAALDRLDNYDSGARIGVGNINVYDVSSSSSRTVAAAYLRWKGRKAEADALAASLANAREDAKTEAIAAFVAASGDAMLIQQHKEGLLCRKTITSRMATAALDACGLPAACPNPVVCDNNECPCGDSTVDCIPPDIYRTWKAFTLPEGSTVEFHRVRNCLRTDGEPYYNERGDAETAGSTEYDAVVTIPSGPFQFTRRVKLEGK